MSITRKEIWNTLFGVDVSQHVKFLGFKSTGRGVENMPYLPWATMHVLMMEHFPEYSWSFSEDHHMREAHYYEGGSCEVRCTMTIGDHTIITSLPVAEGDEALAHPHAALIGNAKQRCRVKAAGEFGLGFLLWHDPDSFQNNGEKAETAPVTAPKKKANYISEEEYFAKHCTAKKTRPEAVAGKKKLLGALKNRKKPVDGVEAMWAKLCEANGWTA